VRFLPVFRPEMLQRRYQRG